MLKRAPGNIPLTFQNQGVITFPFQHDIKAPYLIASLVIAILVKQIGDLLHVDGVVEGCSVTDLTLVWGHLPLQTLDQVTDGHTGRDGVGVDDDIWCDTLGCERHVLVLDWSGHRLD